MPTVTRPLKCGSWNNALDCGYTNGRVCFDCAGLDAPGSDMVRSAICYVLVLINFCDSRETSFE